MPTVTTNTIGASGADYTSIQAWQDDAPADLVTNDEIWRGEIIDDTHDEAGVVISGSNVDDTRYKHLTVADADQHDGTAGSGKRILPTSTGHVFDVQETFKCSWLEITDWGASGSPSDEAFRLNTSGTLKLESIIAHDALGGDQHDVVYWGVEDGSLEAWNCAAWDIARAMFWSNTISDKTGGGMWIRNCVAYDMGVKFTTDPDRPIIGIDNSFQSSNNDLSAFTFDVRNTYVALDSGADADMVCYGWWANTGPNIPSGAGNNGSSDDTASIPSANGTQYENVSPSGEFENLTDGSIDLHIVSGGTFEDAGQDVSGVTVPVTSDIDGDSRPAGSAYDVGFDEFVPQTATDAAGISDETTSSLTTAESGIGVDDPTVSNEVTASLSTAETAIATEAAGVTAVTTTSLSTTEAYGGGEAFTNALAGEALAGTFKAGTLIAVSETAGVSTVTTSSLTTAETSRGLDEAGITAVSTTSHSPSTAVARTTDGPTISAEVTNSHSTAEAGQQTAETPSISDETTSSLATAESSQTGSSVSDSAGLSNESTSSLSPASGVERQQDDAGLSAESPTSLSPAMAFERVLEGAGLSAVTTTTFQTAESGGATDAGSITAVQPTSLQTSESAVSTGAATVVRDIQRTLEWDETKTRTLEWDETNTRTLNIDEQ